MKQVPAAVSGPIPILAMVVLVGLSLAKNYVPQGLPPVGIILAIFGLAFMALYVAGWVREVITLISSWLLLGFGVAHWASEIYRDWSASLILLGLGAGFFGISLMGSQGGLVEENARKWPNLAGLFLVILGVILGVEVQFGRLQVWNALLPLIPVVFLVYMIYLYRQMVALKGPS